jgi:hypothetical protein
MLLRPPLQREEGQSQREREYCTKKVTVYIKNNPLLFIV